jgi:hypothetical protein
MMEDLLHKYENVDASKYALDLNIYQVAYLNKLLPGAAFRFQPEENAKKKVQSLKKNLNKKRNAKSVKSDSAISNSERFSESEKDSSIKKAPVSSKTPSSRASKPKSQPNIPDNMKPSFNRLMEVKQDANKRLTNIVKEIDFDSLEEGIVNKFFTTPQEFESQAKQVFGIVIKRYEGSDLIKNSLSKLLKTLLLTEEGKVEEAPRAPAPAHIPPLQQKPLPSLQHSGMQPQQSQGSMVDTQAYGGKPKFCSFPQITAKTSLSNKRGTCPDFTRNRLFSQNLGRKS